MILKPHYSFVLTSYAFFAHALHSPCPSLFLSPHKMPSISSEATITPTNNINTVSFEAFLEGWLSRQQNLLDELLKAQDNSETHLDQFRALIARVMLHFQEYYQNKSIMIARNVFLLFSPTWLSPLERALLWNAGFNPNLAFQLVISSVNDITEDQSQKIESLRHEINVEQKLLEKDLAKIQESVAAPPLTGLARREGRQWLLDGETREVNPILVRLRSEMESLVVDADSLRRRVSQELVEILYPMQNVRFLAASMQLHLSIWVAGRQREAEQLQHGEVDRVGHLLYGDMVSLHSGPRT